METTADMGKLQLEDAAAEGLRVVDVVGALLDQPFAAQIWILSGAVFVWMGSSGDQPSLRCVCESLQVDRTPP